MEKITTIQMRETAKRALDRIKQSGESYEDTILKLIENTDLQKRSQKKLLIEGYKAMTEESLKITRDFEAADREVEETYGN